MKSTEQTQQQSQYLENESENIGSMPSLMPPAFNLTAETLVSEDGRRKSHKKKSESNSNESMALEGPIAAKGEGDEHAFAQDDMYQGNVGDCWLMASLAAIAKANPSLLEEIIKPLERDRYEVRLYKREVNDRAAPLVEKRIIVNNQFPVHHGDNTPVYAGRGDDDGEIWPMIIEKAIVLLFGGKTYQFLDGGDTIDAMEALTGQPAKRNLIESRKSSKEGSDRNYEKSKRKFEKGNPGASDAELAKFGPQKELLFDVLREWEILPMIEHKMLAGEAVVVSSKDWGGKLKKVEGFTIIGPHAYSILGMDLNSNTVSLSDPYGQYNLYNLPAKILRTHFSSVESVVAAKTSPQPSKR